MKTVVCFTITITSVIASAKASPLHQDSLSHAVFIGFLGDNYTGSIVSLNYSYRFTGGLIVYGGPGNPVKYKAANSLPPFTSFSASAGVLYRFGTKRNGFSAGLSFSAATGKWVYASSYSIEYVQVNNAIEPRKVYYYSYHDVDFEIYPSVSYLLQSKSTRYFCRFSLGPKLFSSLFLDSYDDKETSHANIFPWFGLSFGGAW